MGRGGDAGHDVRRVPTRRVDRHVREAVPLEEGEGVGALVLLHPRAVPELDERDEGVEQRPGRLQLLHCLPGLLEPRRVLQQHAAELARALERRQRLAELGERLLVVGLFVPGHPLARLRVEDETVRRPLRPLRGGLGRGQVVERRVDLDRVEALGVVGESRRRRGDALRVPALDQAVVGPGAGPDPDQVRTTTLLLVPEKPASVAPTQGTGGWLAMHADAPRLRPGAAMRAVSAAVAVDRVTTARN